MSETDTLIKKASEARGKAYAPHSNHPVGAALVTDTGAIYTGCNVENAAYPLGACAEALAIGNMVLAGDTYIRKIVVAGPGEHLCTPCGGCRQKIREFGDSKTEIIICDKAGEIMLETSLGELLPHSFGPENLKNG